MNELIQKLIECLNQETARYRNLAVLVEQQKDYLVTGEMGRLSGNVRLEEKEVFALSPIVHARNELLAQMAKQHHLKSMNLTEALERAPLEWVEELKTAVIELVQSAKRLEKINKSNEKLLNNAMSYVKFTLSIIANGGKKKIFSPRLTLEEKNSSYVNRVV